MPKKISLQLRVLCYSVYAVDSISELLTEIYLFQFFGDEDLEHLMSICKLTQYKAGSKIIEQGDRASSMFIIQSGCVKLTNKSDGENTVIGILGTGSHFGELPFLDGLGRALGIETTEDSVLYEISYADLSKLFEANIHLSSAFYKAVAIFLASRLRSVTMDLSFEKERNLKYF